MRDLEYLVSSYYKLLEYRKMIDSELQKLRKELLQHIPVGSKIQIGEFVISVKKYQQTRLDVNKLKEFLGDNYNDFLRVTEVVRLEVRKNEHHSEHHKS